MWNRGSQKKASVHSLMFTLLVGGGLTSYGILNVGPIAFLSEEIGAFIWRSTLNIKAAISSETSAHLSRSAPSHMSETQRLCRHRCENAK